MSNPFKVKQPPPKIPDRARVTISPEGGQSCPFMSKAYNDDMAYRRKHNVKVDLNSAFEAQRAAASYGYKDKCSENDFVRGFLSEPVS